MNVFITGVSRGLGHRLANYYANQGHSVFGISRSAPAGLPATVQHACIDVTSVQASARIESFVRDVPMIDVLINNAGTGSFGFELRDTSPEQVSHQLQVHCVGPLRVTKALLPKLMGSANPKVINVTSRLGSVQLHLQGDFRDRNFSYAYRIAKCAQNMLSLCMADDKSLDWLVVASVYPGLLQTDSGSSDALHSAEEGARQMAALIHNISSSGIYHAFGEEALY